MPEEIKQEVILKTQKYLGKYVKKPPLSDKLLKKPPFRFLHDIINTVIKETGFLKGLFSEEELISENVKEKDAKIIFLSKLIDAVKIITNTDLAVRPSKIVAGLEPTETNLLLQAIGRALDKKLDSSNYVNQLHSSEIINEKSKKSKKNSEKNDKTRKVSKTTVNNDVKRNTPRNKEKQTKSNLDTPLSTNRQKSKRGSKDSKTDFNDVKLKTKENEKTKKKVKEVDNGEASELTPETDDNVSYDHQKGPLISVVENKDLQSQIATKISEEISNDELITNNVLVTENLQPSETKTDESRETSLNDTAKKRSSSASRPKSARPRSGDLREKYEEKNESSQIQNRPRSSLRPPSVRPSSARPGAPRLRPDSGFPIKEVIPMGKINVIVESFDKDVDEEETVIIQSNPETVQQNEHIDIPDDNKGHLVEQILEQINENDEKLTIKPENDWQRAGFQGKDTTKETNSLKSLIQNLTKTANPLGKLLNYLHEDIDAMHAELESWSNIKRQLFEEITKQKKLGIEMNKPLTSQLEHLNREIKKMEEDIVNTRSNILRNDMRIKEFLAK